MQKKNSSKNVFDEIDRDIDEFKTAIKISRQERILKSQRKILLNYVIFLLILATGFICVGTYKKVYAANLLSGIMCLFFAVVLCIYLKKISQPNHRKGGKA